MKDNGIKGHCNIIIVSVTVFNVLFFFQPTESGALKTQEENNKIMTCLVSVHAYVLHAAISAINTTLSHPSLLSSALTQRASKIC